MPKKKHHFMFCYSWSANNRTGDGYKILHNDKKELTMKDINQAKGFIKESIEKQMHHNKESIQVIFSSINHLSYCSDDEFYND